MKKINGSCFVAGFVLSFVFIFSFFSFFNSYAKIIQIVKSDFQAKLPISSIIKSIETNYNEGIFQRNTLINIYGATQRLLFNREDNGILKDNNNVLQSEYIYSDITDKADNCLELKFFCDSLNVPMLYVMPPTRMILGYTSLPDFFVNEENRVADDFFEEIQPTPQGEGIPYLDMRKSLADGDFSFADVFYKTDHHWTTEASFWGYQILVDKINEEFDFNLDSTTKFRNLDNFKKEEYEAIFLGSKGANLGKYYMGMDNYTLILPNFETSFSLSTSNRSSLSGPYKFEEGLINRNYITGRTDNRKPFRWAYSVYQSGDHAEYHIVNHLSDNNKKILVIKDSYALPITSFLSLTTSQVSLIDLRLLTDISAKQYIENYNPDLVIILYNVGAFKNELLFEFG